MVDELKLVVAPTIAGEGRKLLDGVPAARLEVARSVTSPTGHLIVDYRVTQDRDGSNGSTPETGGEASPR